MKITQEQLDDFIKLDNVTTPQAVANFFIEKGIEKKLDDMTIMKIMKLVYVFYGYCLAYRVKLFNEDFLAWKYGPVLPSLYSDIKNIDLKTDATSEASNITKSIEFISYKENSGGDSIEISKEEGYFDFNNDMKEVENADYKATIKSLEDFVFTKYKDINGWDLSTKTHKRDTPWRKVYVEDLNNKLNDKDILEHYIEKVKTEIING